MARFIVRRLLTSVVVLLIIVTVSFLLVRAVPGNPFADERGHDAATMRNMLAAHGMDKPLFPIYRLPDPNDPEAFPVVWDEAPAEFVLGRWHLVYGPRDIAQTQYVRYMVGLVQGDLGRSLRVSRDKPVIDIIDESYLYSVQLGLQALLVALLIGVPAGLIAGLKQNRWQDYTVMTGAMVGISVPNFVLGPLLILVFAMWLGWFRVNGWVEWKDSVLPSFALGLFFAAYIARLTRGGMLEVVRQDYIRTARAKGLAESAVVGRHAVKGAMLPVVSYLGPATAALLTGSVVVERVFGLPGLGKFFVDAAVARDYNLVLGLVIVYSVLLIVMNLLVDIAYSLLDPRVRYE